MFGIIKKVFVKKLKKETLVLEPIKKKVKFTDQIDKIALFFSKKFNDFIHESKTIQFKLKNLAETNYQLGLRHLQAGHLSDAIFRFKFIKKFWPDNYDAYYQLAYSLLLKKRNNEAKEVLEELIKKDPSYASKAEALLSGNVELEYNFQEDLEEEELPEELEIKKDDLEEENLKEDNEEEINQEAPISKPLKENITLKKDNENQ
jgi:tetratricopeptide (TPR) repeat protein